MKPFSENWVPDIKVWQAELGYPKLDASSEKVTVIVSWGNSEAEPRLNHLIPSPGH